MLKKMLARFGKGSAKVQVVLDQSQARMGESISGQIHVIGGTVAQSIRKIDVYFNLEIFVKEHRYTKTIQHTVIDEAFQLEPSQERDFPFLFTVPNHLLVSGSQVFYQVVAELDIESGVDSVDRKPIEILPTVRLQNLFTALQNLGFTETHESRSYDGFLQEFEWAPTDLFSGQIEEIEFHVVTEEEGIQLLLEVDVYSFLGEKEVRRELFLDNSLLDDVESLASYLQQVIEEVIQQPSIYHADKRAFQTKYLSATGAVGAVAAGLVAIELLEKLEDEIEDLVEDLAEDDDDEIEDEEDDDFFFDDEED